MNKISTEELFKIAYNHLQNKNYSKSIELFNKILSHFPENLSVLRNLVNEGITMLIVTHELGFASKFGDKIVFMDAGEIIESGPPNTILKSPKTERLKLFLEKLSLTSL